MYIYTKSVLLLKPIIGKKKFVLRGCRSLIQIDVSSEKIALLGAIQLRLVIHRRNQ